MQAGDVSLLLHYLDDYRARLVAQIEAAGMTPVPPLGGPLDCQCRYCDDRPVYAMQARVTAILHDHDRARTRLAASVHTERLMGLLKLPVGREFLARRPETCAQITQMLYECARSRDAGARDAAHAWYRDIFDSDMPPEPTD